MSITTRFAPSPTGYLHLGHAFSALTAWRRARAAEGRFLLRIEDIDTTRCRPAFAQAIERDLAWLGLDWDAPVRRQSDHFHEYQADLDTLSKLGLLYPCFCTRADIAREVTLSAGAPHAPDGGVVYPGTCADLAETRARSLLADGAPHALRLRVGEAASGVGTLDFHDETVGRVICAPQAFGDIVLARKDTPTSYHLCVTHDDALQGVTLVTRGVDLLAATDIHRLLQAVLGWPAPAYAHHPMLTDSQGRRFAKRDNAVTLRTLREQGVTAAEIIARIDAVTPKQAVAPDPSILDFPPAPA
jgi:glutamyl-Q tRNA(Asp) synthetase